MGEFIIYYRGKIVGGIYDDRLLVKSVKSAICYMPTAPYELPYEGAKEMLLEQTTSRLRSNESPGITLKGWKRSRNYAAE